MRKSSVMPTRRSEAEVIDANADEWLLAGASASQLVSGRLFLGRLLLSRARFRFAGTPSVAFPPPPQKARKERRGACGNFVLDNESPIQGLG
jgi:hypothetical protein